MSPIAWRSRSSKIEDSNSLGLQIPAGLMRVFKARGFTDPDEVQRFLYPQTRHLKDPYSLKGMTWAIDRMVQAFVNSEKICVYADFDLDGTSGLALLVHGLNRLGYRNLIHYQPRRLNEGYGFHASAVEDLSRQGVNLIITVDVGITSCEAVRKANELGINVILTDHHLPTHEIPQASVIINPNQKDCTSGLNYLSGAGVAFYFLRALKRAFFENPTLPKNDFDLKEVLDLFTIATITDMVPLIDDNRVLVKHGLTQLKNTQRPGLFLLLEELGLKNNDLTSQDVSLRLAPKINALSRMETDVLPRDLYLTQDLEKAHEIVSHVLKNNSDRVEKQSQAEGVALEQLKTWQNPHFIFVISKEFHRGVVGLVATKLATQFNKPCFVGSITEGEGTVVGSARVPNGSEVGLVDALQSVASHLNRFGGHASAAGFEFHLDQFDGIVRNLSQYFNSFEKQENPRFMDYDTELKATELTNQFMDWHDFLGPYGVGFPVPLFRMGPFRLVSLKELKGKHFKMEVESLSGERLKDVLYFSPPTRVREQLQPDVHFEILGEVQKNHFMGRRSLQVLVKDLKLTTLDEVLK